MSLENRSNRTSASFPGLWASKLTLAFFSLLILLQIGNLQAQTCTVTDYLYLNDVTTNSNGNGIGYVHKLRLNAGISATEIYSSGTNPWFPAGGVLKTPHGLGQDLNGNLYIGQTGDGPIAKIKCNGTVVNANFINDGGFNVVSKDGYLYIDDNGSNRINRYSLCDGSAQGYIVLNGDFSYGSETMKDWGLEIDPNGTFYVTAGFNVLNNNKNTYIYRFKPTDANFTAHTAYTAQLITGVGVSLKPGTGDSGISNTNEVWGITHDPAGNMYVVVRDRTDDTNKETWILKYNKNFTLVDYIMEKDDTPTGGIEGARGIVYYAPWDRLLIAGGPDGDCVAKVRPSDMVYTGALAPNEPGQTPKTLRIASEACPTAAALTVDTTMCNVQVGDKVFLQNIIGTCNAPICGGTWTASTGNAGITFNECDLSFTVTNVAIGCGKFTLKNVGGTCGDFTITVNVDFANVTAPVLGGNQTVCAGSEIPTPFTTVTPATGSNTIKYQWQKSTASCTAGFTNIANATASTYTPTVLTQTTYYRVVTTVDGSCSTPRGSCADTSNCVTVTTKVCCAKPVVTVTPGTCNPATNQYSISGTISLTNASAGTATITDGTRSTTVAIAATATSVAYSLAGLTSGTGSHTVTVSLPGCGSDDAVYTAPASCTVAPCALNVVVTPGTCNSATNQYSISGTVALTSAVAGTLSITDGVKSTTVAVAAGATSVAYSLTGLTSGSGSHTVVSSLTGCGTDFITYAAPASCTVCTVNLVTSTLPNGQVGTAYSRTLVTSGGTTPYTYAVSTGTLPAGLSLNPTTGVISGTPTAATTSVFSIKVTDAKSCTDVQSFTITTVALPVCSLDLIVIPGTCNAATNQYSISGTVGLTNPVAGNLVITDGVKSTTLTITASTTSVSYSLTGLTSGSGSHTVTSSLTGCGTDFITYAAPASCTVCTVNLVTSTLPDGQVGTAYSRTLVTSGGTTPYTYAVSTGTLPAGLSLNATTGVLSGTPTAPATSVFSIKVTDAKSCTDVTSLTIVTSALPVCSLDLLVTPGTCNSVTNQYSISGTVGLTNPVAGNLVITDGAKSTTLTITASTTSVAYSLTGLTSGSGSHTVVASLSGCGTDNAAYSAPASCTVAPPAIAVVVGAPTCNSLTNQYTATGTVSLTNATAGTLTITDNGNSIGTISVTAGQATASFSVSGVSNAGSHTVVATLTGGPSATTTYTAPASCTVCSLSLTTASLPNGEAGTPYSQMLTTTGGTAPLTYTISVGSLPTGLTLNPTTGLIAGMPTAAGSFTATLRVTDSKGCLVNLPLTVFDINTGPVCSIGLAVTPGVCSSATNTYTLSGMVSLSNNTTGGTILITSGLTTTTLTVSSTATLVPFSLTGLGSDGLVHTVTATLSGCGSKSTIYTAPASCTQPVSTKLTLDKMVNLSKAKLGDILTYTLVLTNTGTTIASNIVVTDSSTVGLNYVAGSAAAPAGTTFTQGSPISTWQVASISAGQSLMLTFQAKADSSGILYNKATIPGDTAIVCTSIPVVMCVGDVYTFRLTVPAGRSSYKWFRDNVEIVGQTTNSLDITGPGTYSLAVDNTTGKCPDFSCCPFIIEEDSLPAFKATAIPVTCVGKVLQANGKIVLSSFDLSNTYQYSAGSVFNPAASLSGTAKSIPTGGVLVSNLTNPLISESYTVRVYNRSGCFKDVTVTLLTTVCDCLPDACVPFVLKQTKRAKRIGDAR